MATADISQVGRSIWANTDFDRGLEKVAVLQDFLEDNADGVVTLSQIGPIWTIDRQDKSLKSHAVKSAAVGKFQSIRLNVTTPNH